MDPDPDHYLLFNIIFSLHSTVPVLVLNLNLSSTIQRERKKSWNFYSNVLDPDLDPYQFEKWDPDPYQIVLDLPL